MKIIKQPPVGITVQEHGLVRPSGMGDREQPNAAELVLTAELDGNPLVLYLVEGMTKRSFESYIDGMVKVFSKRFRSMTGAFSHKATWMDNLTECMRNVVRTTDDDRDVEVRMPPPDIALQRKQPSNEVY